MLEDGLERRKLVGHDSYAKPFFDTEDKFFRENPYRFQVLFLNFSLNLQCLAICKTKSKGS